MFLLIRSGLLLSFAAVFLQIAVFLQPLLPAQYQIAPVCESISRALLLSPSPAVAHSQHAHPSSLASHSNSHAQSHEHDHNHQCQYCTVYGNLVLPPELGVKEVLDRIQIRLMAIQQALSHVWFVLQRLFLIPQGRAPPQFA